MMKRTLLIAILFCFVLPNSMLADSWQEVLIGVEQNNTSLRALRDGVEAEKAENHTGLTLSDPEITYSHYWGSPTSMRARNDLSVSQSFDYAMLFGIKRRAAQSKDQLADIRYEEQRHEVLLQASRLLVNVVYYNRCLAEHRRQQDEMQQAAKLAERAYEEGKISRMDCNKSRILLAELSATIAQEELERQEQLSLLRLLNGGSEVVFADTVYSISPAAFANHTAFAGRSALTNRREQAEQQVAEDELRVARAASVPQLTVGYVSELTREEKFRGVTVGLSVPLWSNKANVRRARARQVAARSEQEDVVSRLQNEYEALRQRAERQQQYVQTLQAQLPALSNAPLLRSAFLRGDVSALDYYSELSADYDFHHRILQAERDYQLLMCELGWF